MKVDRTISFERIGMRFPTTSGELQVLSDITFSVPEGQFISILGRSGCGKSTLLRLVSNLLTPSEGEIKLGGKDPGSSNLSLGFMFQTDTLLPWATVIKNIELGLELSGRVAKADRRERAKHYLDMVGLGASAESYPHQLSGGMRKRVDLARILAYDPDVFLMDEPFGALDAQTKIDVENQFLDIWQQMNKSVIFITHDIDESIALSDRIVVLPPRSGKIVLDLPVSLPRPRDFYGVRFEPGFRAISQQIWESLREQGPSNNEHGGA